MSALRSSDLAAAKRLGVYHATVIPRIDRPDGKLGAKLFSRRKTGYEITDASRRVTAVAEAIESKVGSGQAEISVAPHV